MGGESLGLSTELKPKPFPYHEMDRHHLSRLRAGRGFFIDKLFGHGLDLLHLRKPGASADECRDLLERIPERWRGQVVLHEHFELAEAYGAHGIHLNRRNPQAPEGYGGSVSCSCHSLEEVAANKPRRQYVFLSPIFDSISKVGYAAAFPEEQLRQAAKERLIDRQVVALGGVTATNIAALKAWHFGGAAFLGDVWSRMGDPNVDAYLAHLRQLLHE